MKRIYVYFIYTHTFFFWLLKLNPKNLNIIEYADLYILNNYMFKEELWHRYHIPSPLLSFIVFIFVCLFCVCEGFQSREKTCFVLSQLLCAVYFLTFSIEKEALSLLVVHRTKLQKNLDSSVHPIS